MSNRGLAGLPNETLHLIALFLDLEDPKALATLSQTCRRTNSICHELVTARRDMDQKYRVIHDRHPLNVLKLLKLASDNDSRETWHVRRAEFWCPRAHLDDWCAMSSSFCTTWPASNRDPPDQYGPQPSCGQDGDSHAWQMNQETREMSFKKVPSHHVEEARVIQAEGRCLLQRDVPVYRSMLDKMHGLKNNDFVRREVEALERGRDELCKAMLLSLCQNLNTLIFLAFDEPGLNHPILLLSAMIRQCHISQASAWHPGFLSLRKISINSESDAREKTVFPGTHEFGFSDINDIKPLFTLPNLKVLRLGCVFRCPSPRPDRRHLPPTGIVPGTSSIEALEIAKCDLVIEDIHYLLSLPRRLRYFQSDDPYTPANLRSLHNCPDSVPKSLERLSFRSVMGHNLWVLANYTSLQQVDGITADCLVWHLKESAPAPTGPQECFEFPVRGDGHEFEAGLVTLEALELTLPPNVETLSIHFLVMEDRGFGFFNAFIRELLRNVSGQAADEAHTGADFLYLKEVTFLLQNGTLPEDFEWDDEALAGLDARGICVVHKQMHSTTELPEFEEVDESKWEHCLEDRHYTDPRLDAEVHEGRKFGMVRSYVDHSQPERDAPVQDDD